jgi:hypothetical protein
VVVDGDGKPAVADANADVGAGTDVAVGDWESGPVVVVVVAVVVVDDDGAAADTH